VAGFLGWFPPGLALMKLIIPVSNSRMVSGGPPGYKLLKTSRNAPAFRVSTCRYREVGIDSLLSRNSRQGSARALEIIRSRGSFRLEEASSIETALVILDE